MNAITCMKKYQHNWGCIKQELKKKKYCTRHLPSGNGQQP